jgi:citrate lyase subunit beta/citryl-CoA lyase
MPVRYRSLLVIPSDNAALDAAWRSGADAVVVRWNGAAPLPAGRAGGRRPALFFSLAVAEIESLGPMMAARPAGILLTDARSGADLQRLSGVVAAHEAMLGIADGATAILAIIGSPAGLLDLASFRGASARLGGLGYDAAAVAAAMGCAPREEDGRIAEPLRVARALVLATAAAAGVPAYEAPPATPNPARLSSDLRAAGRDGFAGALVADPGAVELVNRSFPPRSKVP